MSIVGLTITIRVVDDQEKSYLEYPDKLMIQRDFRIENERSRTYPLLRRLLGSYPRPLECR
jgi:hypothetical protein